MSRLDLDAKLKAVTQKHGMKLYYQPPASLKITYPCVVYEGTGTRSVRADNGHYILFRRYNITFITKKEDPGFIKEILGSINYGSIDREFISDNLYHTVLSCSEIY